jgi:hypothetical protein
VYNGGGTERGSGWAEMGVSVCSEGSPDGMPSVGECERDDEVCVGGCTWSTNGEAGK